MTENLSPPITSPRLGVVELMLQSSSFLALEGFCGAALAGEALSVPFNLIVYLIPTAVIFAGYTFDRLGGMRSDADRINQPLRYQYFQRYGRLTLAMAAVALGLVFVLCALRSVALGVFLIALPVGLSALYSFGWKHFFPQARFTRLKDIIFVKTLLVGPLWGVVLVLAPALYLDLSVTAELVWVYGYVSWRIMFNTVIFDLADLEGDRQAGTRTLPVVWGARNTMRALVIMNVLSVGWVARMNWMPWPVQAAFYVGILLAFGYLYGFNRVRDRHRFINLVVDGEFLFTFVVWILLSAAARSV
ncbi:MAG: UbiA family prenyltransferase [Chloroflexi bacterium]|nr:UbiA family prenyltransferase [Chloroflexota bacterium]